MKALGWLGKGFGPMHTRTWFESSGFPSQNTQVCCRSLLPHIAKLFSCPSPGFLHMWRSPDPPSCSEWRGSVPTSCKMLKDKLLCWAITHWSYLLTWGHLPWRYSPGSPAVSFSWLLRLWLVLPPNHYSLRPKSLSPPSSISFQWPLWDMGSSMVLHPRIQNPLLKGL